MRLIHQKRFFYPAMLLCGFLPSLPLLGMNGMWGFFLSVPLLCLLFAAVTDAARVSHLRITIGGGLAMYGYFLSVFSFLFGMYPLSFIRGMTPEYALLIVLLCWLLLPLLQAALFAPAFLLFSLSACMKTVRRHPLLLILLYSGLYAAFEWLQNLGWFGVPFGGQAVGQVQNAYLLQTASLFGAYYITFVLLIVNGALAFCLLSLYRSRDAAFAGVRAFFREGRGAALLSAAVFLGINLTGGGILYHMPEEEAEPVTVGLIQTNHASLDKTQVSIDTIWTDAKRLAIEAVGKGADVLLYSETMLTTSLLRYSFYGYDAKHLSEEHGVTQILGAFYADEASGERKVYNSLYFINGDGSYSDTRYDKRHLVPFGEYLPMPEFFRAVLPFVCELMRESELSAGDTTAVYDGGEFGHVGSLICFDSIYPELTRESVLDGATWIALATNDSWFSSTQAINIHLAHARLRAVENGRYVARTAATGRSAVIDTKGRLTATTGEGEAAACVAEILPQSGLTLYTVVGDLFPLLSLSMPLCLLLWEGIQAALRRRRASDVPPM